MIRSSETAELSSGLRGRAPVAIRAVLPGSRIRVVDRYAPWMTTIVDLDTGQVLGVVDGRDHKTVGDWLFARPPTWRLG